MKNLAGQKCIPCEGDVPPLKGEELKKFQTQLDKEVPGWEIKNDKQLEKTFKFTDFKSSLEFVNQIGAIAEAEQHHPNIEFSWGFVKVTIWTHAINGLSDNDFFLAAKIG